jgi:hypothetical protein
MINNEQNCIFARQNNKSRLPLIPDMQINSDFTADNTPKVSNVMKQFIVELIKNEISHPGNFERSKKHLKAYCRNERLNFSTLEYNLILFFALNRDYSQMNTPALYEFMKFQSQFCFLDETMFGLLAIVPAKEYFFSDPYNSSGSSDLIMNSGSSKGDLGLVGGHIIGLY